MATAKTQKDIEFRTHTVAMCEKEIAGERKFLGMPADDYKMTAADWDDDLLLAELMPD